MKKILVAEDEPAYLKLLCDQLTAKGYYVFVAKNGKEGLKLALENKPDLILLDLIMPEMDGLTMLKILRQDTWGKSAIVFIITNVEESKEISEGMEYKASRYIVKSDWTLKDIVESVGLVAHS